MCTLAAKVQRIASEGEPPHYPMNSSCSSMDVEHLLTLSLACRPPQSCTVASLAKHGIHADSSHHTGCGDGM